MADITDHTDHTTDRVSPSPTELEESQPQSLNNGEGGETIGLKRHRPSTGDEDDDDDEKAGRERRKIEIKFISDKSRRHITFSKRKAGIMKKAYELSVLTGTQVLLLVVSETGLVYTFTTPKLQPLVTKAEGKNLIQACLNAPEPPNANESGADEPVAAESPEDLAPNSSHIHLPSRPAISQPHLQSGYRIPVSAIDPSHAAMGYPHGMYPQQRTQQHPHQQAAPSQPQTQQAQAGQQSQAPATGGAYMHAAQHATHAHHTPHP